KMKFTALKKHLQENGAQPIYLLDGEESYFRDRGVEMLKAAVIEPALNYTAYTGGELKGDKLKTLADAVYTLPFLSEKRMVLVTEFYPTEKEYASFLKPLFESPVNTTIFVIANGGGGKPKPGACDWKKKPNVTYVDCGRADEEDVTKWIYVTLKRAGVVADGAVCNAIKSYCLSDMARVSKETEKLIEYAGEGGKLTLQDVDELVYKDSEYKIYELTQAAARKDHATFMKIMDGMVGKGWDENAFLNALSAHFRTLCEVSLLEGNNALAAETLGMKEYAVKKSREQAARFEKGALIGYYRDLQETLATARAGEITFPSALKTAISKIFFKTY
ncbi:MAG: DNA polymerase III subunit delta, partial [Clostridia bacterium]|nr:DNA polymerase III subunit delta [Clostridia bacterium]